MFTLTGNSKLFKETPHVSCLSYKVELQEKYITTLSAEKHSDDSEYTQNGQFLHFVSFAKAATPNS